MDVVQVIVDALRSAIGVNGAVFALAAVGLNLHFGYTGLLNFGHVAFLMVGAYGTALVATDNSSFEVFGLVTVGSGSLFVGVVVGMGLAVLLALMLGLPTLRLRADYLAIVTIAISEILRLLFRSGVAQPVTRGVFGVQKYSDGFYLNNPFDSGFSVLGRSLFSPNAIWVVLVTWLLVLVTSLFMWQLTRSPWGRVIRSIREDEDAARSLGKNVFSYKMQSLIVGGVIGGLAGSMRALSQQSINPDSFLPIFTFFVYAVLILGGPGTILGPIVGAIIFWFLIQGIEGVLREGVGHGWIPAWLVPPEQIPAVRFALVGLGLMLLMAFRPQGIFGSREEMLLDA
ncbi:MAG: branched-chain amino acid ABC transporter permease [Actinobacteria bacterium]|nr:branched-chain amino acid ABC transporter permease [Actinomycetota bacterium]